MSRASSTILYRLNLLRKATILDGKLTESECYQIVYEYTFNLKLLNYRIYEPQILKLEIKKVSQQ